VGWAIRLAKRLEALHALGVFHGSVSASCVETAGAERASRGRLADVRTTTSNVAYQSPERVLGGDLSTADDTWAVAAVLYFLLTGTSPFAAGSDDDRKQKTLAARGLRCRRRRSSTRPRCFFRAGSEPAADDRRRAAKAPRRVASRSEGEAARAARRRRRGFDERRRRAHDASRGAGLSAPRRGFGAEWFVAARADDCAETGWECAESRWKCAACRRKHAAGR
jgi:hypothetical protein